jgi:hypothetical protein
MEYTITLDSENGGDPRTMARVMTDPNGWRHPELLVWLHKDADDKDVRAVLHVMAAKVCLNVPAGWTVTIHPDHLGGPKAAIVRIGLPNGNEREIAEAMRVLHGLSNVGP